jgi:hypothetical protein
VGSDGVRTCARAHGPHYAPKAKNVIYLHMVGGPPQMDLYDYKPLMNDWFDKDLPESVRNGQRLTTMTSGQSRFPDRAVEVQVRPAWQERDVGDSELLPHTASMADEMCFIRSMNTEAINHEPAITYMQTGNQLHGPPVPGVVGQLRPRLAQPGSPHVRRPRRRADEHRAGAGDRRPALVERLSVPVSTPASASAAAGDPILYINNPSGVPADAAPARRSTASRRSNQLHARADRRSRRRTRASPSTRWPSGCRRACRS